MTDSFTAQVTAALTSRRTPNRCQRCGRRAWWCRLVGPCGLRRGDQPAGPAQPMSRAFAAANSASSSTPCACNCAN